MKAGIDVGATAKPVLIDGKATLEQKVVPHKVISETQDTLGDIQRGGSVVSHVRISIETRYGAFIPEGHADIILGMEPVETLRVLGKYGNPSVATIANPRLISSVDIFGCRVEYPDLDKIIKDIKELSAKWWIIDAVDEALKLGNPIFANVILLGALICSGLLPLDKKSMESVLQEAFPKEVKANMIAFNKGMELIRQE